MKNFTYSLCALLLLLVTVGCGSTTPQVKKAKKLEAQEKKIVEIIYSKNYRILVRYGPSASYDYWFDVKDSIADASLMYYGKGGEITFNDRGIQIENDPITNYNMVVTTNRTLFVTFNVRTPDDYYKVGIEVYLNGKTYLSITPNNKQAITYEGMLDM